MSDFSVGTNSGLTSSSALPTRPCVFLGVFSAEVVRSPSLVVLASTPSTPTSHLPPATAQEIRSGNSLLTDSGDTRDSSLSVRDMTK